MRIIISPNFEDLHSVDLSIWIHSLQGKERICHVSSWSDRTWGKLFVTKTVFSPTCPSKTNNFTVGLKTKVNSMYLQLILWKHNPLNSENKPVMTWIYPRGQKINQTIGHIQQEIFPNNFFPQSNALICSFECLVLKNLGRKYKNRRSRIKYWCLIALYQPTQ